MPLVTELSLASQAAYQVEMAQERLGRARSEAADGQRLRRVDDDPAAASWTLGLRQQMQRIEAMRGPEQAVRTEYDAQERALREGIEVLGEAKRTAIGARTPNVSFDDLSQWEVMMRQLQQQLWMVANSQEAGRYLFAGTTDAVAPFSIAGNYAGNAKVRQLEVANNVVLPLNLPGDGIFGPSGVTNAIACMGDCADQIQAYAVARSLGNEDPVAFTGIGTGMDRIDAAAKRMRQGLTSVGAQQRRLNVAVERRERGHDMLQATRQRVSEVDMIEGAQRLQRAQDNLVAAQRSAAELYQTLRGR